jgi:hypothetical protein
VTTTSEPGSALLATRAAPAAARRRRRRRRRGDAPAGTGADDARFARQFTAEWIALLVGLAVLAR